MTCGSPKPFSIAPTATTASQTYYPPSKTTAVKQGYPIQPWAVPQDRSTYLDHAVPRVLYVVPQVPHEIPQPSSAPAPSRGIQKIFPLYGNITLEEAQVRLRDILAQTGGISELELRFLSDLSVYETDIMERDEFITSLQNGAFQQEQMPEASLFSPSGAPIFKLPSV